jgi:hypothetical protein
MVLRTGAQRTHDAHLKALRWVRHDISARAGATGPIGDGRDALG